ncbi:MAG: EAL domain-containing protein, partial [Desulfobacterales bacterium]|nr:EAL domain-containing protein [Desulfobacterales bacterium]
SFVSRIKSEPDGNRNIVEAIISLAHRLEMIVVAEGVETEEQFAILLEMKCQFGQGYLFSKPLSKSKADQLIENIIKLSKENPAANFSLPAMLSN